MHLAHKNHTKISGGTMDNTWWNRRTGWLFSVKCHLVQTGPAK